MPHERLRATEKELKVALNEDEKYWKVKSRNMRLREGDKKNEIFSCPNGTKKKE